MGKLVTLAKFFLDEFFQTPELVNEQYISKNRNKIWYFKSLFSKVIQREGFHHTKYLWQKPGSSCFAKRWCDNILSSFMMLMSPDLLDTVCYISQVETCWRQLGKKGDWRETDAIKKKNLIHWLGHSYKSKNENVLKLWRKRLFFHKITRHQKYYMLTMQVQKKTVNQKTPRHDDKLEPIRDAFEVCNRSSWVSSSFTQSSCWAFHCIQGKLPILGTYTFKTRKILKLLF